MGGTPIGPASVVAKVSESASRSLVLAVCNEFLDELIDLDCLVFLQLVGPVFLSFLIGDFHNAIFHFSSTSKRA